MASSGAMKPSVVLKDYILEVSSFVKNASKPNECNMVELARVGLALIRAIPSTRESVLEFYSTLFDICAFNYVVEIESRGKQSATASKTLVDSTILDEIHSEFSEMIATFPLEWTTVISNWSYEVLGNLCSLYSSRGRSPVNGSLNDSLHQWLSCPATRTLLDLITSSLIKLIDTEKCAENIDTLLDTCVTHSPHFDWAVAYVGTRYPAVIIARVLQSGLSDYISHKGNIANVPKFQSIIGILVHLSGSHQFIVEQSLLNLYNESLQESGRMTTIERNNTVPYVFQLTSMTNLLLPALVKVVVEALKSPDYEKLEKLGPEWIHGFRSRQTLFDLVVHLVLSVTEGAVQIFLLLLDSSANLNVHFSIIAEEILQLLIKELEIAVKGNMSKVPFLENIQKNVQDVLPLLLSENNLQISSVSSVLSFIGHQQPSTLARCVTYVLLRSKDDEHLSSVVKLSLGYKSSSVLSPAIALALNDEEVKEKSRLWGNITKLVKWEASGTLISLPILEAVYDNLFVISNHLCEEKDIKVAHVIAELIRKPIYEYRRRPNFILGKTVIQAIISYFYKCLVDSEGIEEMKALRAINLSLKKLCQESASHRVFALRELLEGALFKLPSVLFGAIPKARTPLIESCISLMNENIKQGHTALMGQRHSSVFHAGIIGSGKRKATPSCPTPYEDIIRNTNLLLTVIKACCMNETDEVSLDAVISVALLLVELISPDVMYNGLPWPDEDSCKVTIERDLSIRRILDNVPAVWSLLAFIAHHRPALCYCSVILRAVVATLINQWFAESQQGHGPGHNKDLVRTTVKILQIMALGQLLPPPFTVLGDVVPYVPPIHVVQILKDCVWNYFKVNVPSPVLFTRDSNGNMWRDTSTSKPPKLFTETLRIVMLKNLPSLGTLYHTIFVEEFS